MTLTTFIFEMISKPTFQRKHVFIHTFIMLSHNVYRVLINRGVGIHFPRNMLLDNFFPEQEITCFNFFYEQFSEIRYISPVTISIPRYQSIYTFIC